MLGLAEGFSASDRKGFLLDVGQQEGQAMRPSGRYDLTKLADCVRLVASARPSRELQERMLATIQRTKGAPTREEIIEAMKESKQNEK